MDLERDDVQGDDRLTWLMYWVGLGLEDEGNEACNDMHVAWGRTEYRACGKDIVQERRQLRGSNIRARGKG